MKDIYDNDEDFDFAFLGFPAVILVIAFILGYFLLK